MPPISVCASPPEVLVSAGAEVAFAGRADREDNHGPAEAWVQVGGGVSDGGRGFSAAVNQSRCLQPIGLGSRLATGSAAGRPGARSLPPDGLRVMAYDVVDVTPPRH